ncbi:MAG: nitroreductase family protein [Bacteroidota bacterium]
MLADLVRKNRSYRRFDSSVSVPAEMLMGLVELARLCPSSRNQQALKFILVNDTDRCALIFRTLAWAGYLKDWPGPDENERPTGYVVILGDTRLASKFDIDLGIVAQTMILGAVEHGFGGCMFSSIKREELRNLFSIPDFFEILLVLAVGKPVETVVIDEMTDGDIRYWRDENQVHHVPKRILANLIVNPGRGE